MDRRQLISIFFIALLLCILYAVFQILSPFFTPIFWGALLAFAFYPIYLKCLALFRNNRVLASIITTGLVLLAFVPMVVFILLMAAKEAAHLYDWLVLSFQNGDAERLIQRLKELPWFQKIIHSRLVPWETVESQWKAWVLDSAGTLGNFALQHVTWLTKNIVSGVFDFFLTFFLLFFFFCDGQKIFRFIYEITPLEELNKKAIFQQLSDTFSATLRGQLFTALAQASVLGLVFRLMDLPMPVFFAALTFLAAMIPVFGSATVWVPFAVYLGVTQQYGRAAMLAVLGTFVISGIDNILKPLLIGQKTKLPYSLLFLGILGGLQVYGFIGVFIAPAFFSLFFVLIKIYREKFAEPSA